MPNEYYDLFADVVVWLLFLLGATLLPLYVYISRRVRRRRLVEAGLELGFHPIDPERDDIVEALCSFGLLQRGVSRRLRQAFRGGLKELQFVIFDYEFDRRYYQKTGRFSGERVDSVDQTVLGFRSPRFDFPSFGENKASGLRIRGKGQLVLFYADGVLLPVKRYKRFIERCMKLLEDYQRKNETDRSSRRGRPLPTN